MSKKSKIAVLIAIPLLLTAFIMLASAAPLIYSSSAILSATEAESIALSRVGLTRENIRFERTELDRERGSLVWEVEFEKENKEYSFEIDAVTGKILREEIEPERKGVPANTTQPHVTNPPTSEPPVTEPPTTQPPVSEKPAATEITREEAINIALAEAGLTREKVREIEVEKDRERGVLVYEVEFEHGRTEYSYEIRANDGKVLTRSIEIDD